MTIFSINTFMLIVIVAIVEVIKRIDSKKFLKPIYAFLPMIVSIGITFITVKELTLQNYFFQFIIYSSVSAYAYDLIKSVLDNMIEKVFKKDK